MSQTVRDVISVNSLFPEYIDEIANSANEIYFELMNGYASKFSNYLSGRDCNLLFSQASTRTYDSFHKAFILLGARNIGGFRSAKESSMDKGESIFHTIDTYIGQGASPRFIVMRDGSEGSAKWATICAFRSFAKKLREFAKMYRNFPQNLILPIIFNGGDGKHSHPSQLLLDCATLKYQFGRISEFNFGECNDIGGSRVVSSHIDASSMLEWNMHLCFFLDAGLNQRQKYGLAKNRLRSFQYNNIANMLPNIDLIYVSRFQFNLRNQQTGDHAGSIFTNDHPRISLNLIQPYGIPVLHARPIDKNAKEIDPDLYDHPLDLSGVQSDFGAPARMAMCIYALNNRLFSLKGIIGSLKPEELGFYEKNLSDLASNPHKMERYTILKLNNSVVIDHIPLGCGGVISNLISEMYPDIQIVLSMNVQGDSPESRPKDNIKLHVSPEFELTRELSNIVALFTDYTAKKSCRVSIFKDGKRVKKWCYRYILNNGDICENDGCITNEKNKEGIHFFYKEENIGDLKIKVCPFCEWPQSSAELTELIK